MSEAVTYPECAQWLQDEYPDDVIIRTFSNGDIEFAMNAPAMEDGERYSLSEEDLPGDWAIEDVTWASGGISFSLTRAINLDREAADG